MDGNECVILDDYSENVETLSILEKFHNPYDNKFVIKNKLNNNYSEHKNKGKLFCKGEYVFQIDDDEIPNLNLLSNLKDIILTNPDVDLFWIPRVNIFKGVTDAEATKWGWDINNPNKWVNWNGGDYQGRLFKNLPYLRWERPLHEKIEGAKVTSKLPKEEDFAIYHNKTIEKQIETNLRYNKDFSEELNKGFKI
jgi:hypothetical protein